MRTLTALFALLLLVGCRDSVSGPSNGNSPNAAVPPPDPDMVLVSVNGKALTVGECDEAVRLRLDPIKRRMEPQRIPEYTKRLKASLIREFVFETLLIEEAQREGITVTEEEERQAMQQIDESIRPRGISADDVLANSPDGEDRLRAEVRTALLAERVLAAYMTNDLAVTDEAVDAYLEQRGNALALPERVRARHILIPTTPQDSPNIKQEKLRKLERIRREILAGSDFSQMARQHSACPTRERGGDLGRFSRGRMAKPFEVAAFSQKTNEVGRIVETHYGYHIIQVLEHTPPGTMSRDEATTRLRQRNRQEALRRLMQKLIPEAEIDPPKLSEFLLK